MGQNNSRPEPPSGRIYCPIDMEMLPVQRFKALGCGHCFCQDCLEQWAEQRILKCPKCRYEERTSVPNLQMLYDFEGTLFIDDPPEDDESHMEIEEMLHAQCTRRGRTLLILRKAATVMTTIELTSAGVKIGGSVTGIVGAGMVITGGVLALTGVGAVAGVPLAMAGAAVGGAGGLAVGGGIIGDIVAKYNELKGANEHLQSDFFHSIQLRILVGRAAKSKNIAQKFNIPMEDAASFVGIVGRSVKFGLTTANLVKAMAVGVARGAGTAGLHVAGIVISAALIPLDLFQLIQSSIRLHKKEKSELAKKLDNLAADLETELIPVLKERNYRLAEIERFDNEKKKHSLVIAIYESKYEELMNNSNISMETIKKEHVILIDTVEDNEAYTELLFTLLQRWEADPPGDSSDSENDEADLFDFIQVQNEED